MIGDLSGYSAVLAFTNYPPANPSGLGDILKQYVDNGGGLVINTYAFSDPWSITGGITNSGYAPLVNVGSNGYVSGLLVQTAPSAIFTGVNLGTLTYFNNSNFSHPTLDAGATLLADDGYGINMIAINASGNIIANNTFPNLDPNNGDYYRLTANELLAVGAVPEPETYAMLLIGLSAIGFAAKRRKA
ncbi:PEP-CTERM sorting domain-containing protein [Duganella sp. FT80W]|uniref:PEP-CTERM sorting domain-containing protein n=2 Tax=Duganella guangzhouensis TaxID=2666084 RepID=A0A6I2L959_9BURK|nr:PEP-CTERM sorting domain-containing protein [Duganella guangzhouensis]